MTAFRHDVSGAIEAYAAYLNAPRGVLPSDEQELFDEDLARARAAMERAWLEATPVQEASPAESVAPARRFSRFPMALTALKRVARRALARA